MDGDAGDSPGRRRLTELEALIQVRTPAYCQLLPPSPTPHWHLGRDGALVLARINHDEPSFGFAGAFGSEIAQIAHSQVKHASLTRRHRCKLIGLTRLADSLRRDFRGQLQFLRPQGLEVHAIEAELVVLLGFEPQYLECDMLQGAQELAISLKQESTVRAGKFRHKLRTLAKLASHGSICANAVLQAKSCLVNDTAQEFVNTSCSGNSILNRHRQRGEGSHLHRVGKTFLTSLGQATPHRNIVNASSFGPLPQLAAA